jgi:lysophospholipase L1-like esterase
MKKVTIVFIILTITVIFPGSLAAKLRSSDREATDSGKTVAIMGSSLAAGWVTNYQSRHDMKNGWAFRLERMLAERGYKTINISVPGDTTDKVLNRMEKDLFPLSPDFVIIGMSLENEGIRGTEGQDPEAVFEKYRINLLKITKKCQEKNIFPILGLCYPCNRFGESDYGYIKRMNLIINSWEFSSINFLGALDNGDGHFPDGGYTYDPDHPGNRGHEEMLYAVVPSMFDAMKSGISSPERKQHSGYLTIKRSRRQSLLSFIPKDIIHSFTTVFSFKGVSAGLLAVIQCDKTHPFIEIIPGGTVRYVSSRGEMVTSIKKIDDSDWHTIAVSHRFLKGETMIFLDEKFLGSLPEQLEPRQFILGGSGNLDQKRSPRKAEYRDWLIYRTSLNEDEVSTLAKGKLLKASLEIYAPLNDKKPKKNTRVKNYARSLSEVIFNPLNTSSDLTRIDNKIKQASAARENELVIVEKQPVEINPLILDDYCGDYEIGPGDVMKIIKENLQLILEDRGQKIELLPESETAFFVRYPMVDITITFNRDQSNQVSGMVLTVGAQKMQAKRIK